MQEVPGVFLDLLVIGLVNYKSSVSLADNYKYYNYRLGIPWQCGEQDIDKALWYCTSLGPRGDMKLRKNVPYMLTSSRYDSTLLDLSSTRRYPYGVDYGPQLMAWNSLYHICK